MGFWQWLTGGSASANTATGAGIGAFIGSEAEKHEKLDEIAGLHRARILQAQAFRDQDEASALCKEPYSDPVYDWGPWEPWEKCSALYTDCYIKFSADRAYHDLSVGFASRWWDLRVRAVKVGFPPRNIPRTISGDVIGTPLLLNKVFDELERDIERHERVREVEQRFGGAQ